MHVARGDAARGRTITISESYSGNSTTTPATGSGFLERLGSWMEGLVTLVKPPTGIGMARDRVQIDCVCIWFNPPLSHALLLFGLI